MGYRFNCLDEPVLIALSKSLLTEFGIHHNWRVVYSYFENTAQDYINSCYPDMFVDQHQDCTGRMFDARTAI